MSLHLTPEDTQERVEKACTVWNWRVEASGTTGERLTEWKREETFEETGNTVGRYITD